MHVHGMMMLRVEGVALGTIVVSYGAAITQEARGLPRRIASIAVRPSEKPWQARYHDQRVRHADPLQRIQADVVNNLV